MEKSRKDPLRGVLIRPASQVGWEDEPLPYLDQYTRSEEMPSNAVNSDEILAELRRIGVLLEHLKHLKHLPEMFESLARLEGVCMRIATSLPSSENVQTVYPAIWGHKQNQARQLLLDLLSDDPEGVDVKRIRAEAAFRGISMGTMKMVKRSMGLKAEKHGTSWLWKWPDRQ